MKLVSDQSIITYLQKFNQYPFEVRLHATSYLIGGGHPVFTVSMKEDINTRDLMTSTSLALGEAYMKGTLDIEGDLF